MHTGRKTMQLGSSHYIAGPGFSEVANSAPGDIVGSRLKGRWEALSLAVKLLYNFTESLPYLITPSL